MNDNKPNLLIVEDDSRMREMLLRASAEAGYECSGARSAEQAMKAVQTIPPQIVLLDLNLPGMDGMDFLRQLHELSPATQVIILTGFGSLDAAKTAIRYDVADFLTKPCRLEDLEIALGRARQRMSKSAGPTAASTTATINADQTERMTLEQLEQKHILATLHRNHGNRTAAASELGISERTLYYRLAQYQRQGIAVD